MKYTSDYKKAALDALRGHWPAALFVTFIYSFFNGGLTNILDINIKKETDLEYLISAFNINDIWPFINIFLAVAGTFAVITAIVSIAVSGALQIGRCVFNLHLIDNGNAQAGDIFSQLSRFFDGFCAEFLMTLYIFLWTLLFIIPGIIKGHAYRMTYYIMAENPGMKPSQAIKESEKLMNGHKMDYFCLNISFIGWALLCSLPQALVAPIVTYGIMESPNPLLLVLIIPMLIASFAGYIVLSAYMSAAEAAFYRSISEQFFTGDVNRSADINV